MVILNSPDYDCAQAPVSVVVPASAVASLTGTPAQGPGTPCQIETAGPGLVRVTWIARDLKRGQAQTYHLQTDAKPVVEARRVGENVDFLVRGQLLTRYDTTTGPNKPYFYPLNAPFAALDGAVPQLVRHWPLEDVPGETHDHPHHRGLWFSHGPVNGVDFWTEGAGKGKTVHTGYETLESGPVYALMRARTDWMTPDNHKIAEDVREMRVYNLEGAAILDFSISVKAVGGPLKWSDSKEGTFALRVADSMRAGVEKAEAAAGKKPEGHIVNAAGDRDGATWGKAANWCDYYGPVNGQTLGIAILDDPNNPHHPTTWMVRDYGLFGANPFGLHAFDAKKNGPDAGDLTVPEGQTTIFRYRLLLHRGTAEEARVAETWNAFAHPIEGRLK